MLRKKLRQMPRDGRVRWVGQAKAAQGRLPFCGRFIDGRMGQKTFDDPRLHLVAREHCRTRLCHQPRAAAEQRDRHGCGRILREQLNLGDTAALYQLRESGGGQTLLAGGQKLRLQPMRKRQIHVVAAEHQVLADGNAGECRQCVGISRLLDANQREVGRAAAHIDHQHQFAVLELRVELIALQHQPVVERGLGFFEQMHMRQARHLRGLQRQRARAFVKRRGHGEHDDLPVERRIGMRGIPRGLHMREIAGRCGDRRDLVHIFRCAPGQDGRVAIDALMREPALGTSHQSRWHGSAQITRPAANHGGLVGAGIHGGPRLLPGRVAEFSDSRVIAHGRQQRLWRDFIGRCALRNLQQRDARERIFQ